MKPAVAEGRLESTRYMPVKNVYMGWRRSWPSQAWHRPVRQPLTSAREIRDLTIALIVLLAVGFSWFRFSFHPAVVGAVVVGVVPAFLLHELAHKFSAMRYGAWAEFRLDFLGLALTAISIVAPFKIIAPGAVMVWSYNVDPSFMGKTSAAGPLTNMALALLFTVLTPFIPFYVVRFAVAFNAWVAFFNLLPFGIFDGRKILAWNWMVWLLLFIAAVGLMAAAYL